MSNHISGPNRMSLTRSLFSASNRKPRSSLTSNSSHDNITEEDDPNDSLRILRNVLKRPSNQRNLKSLHSLITLAKHIQFFKQLASDASEETVAQCCIYMTLESFESGEFIFHQGDEGSKFYVVLDGACSVYLTLQNSDGNYVPTEVATYGKGESFGEFALLNNKPRSASIVCTQASHFAVLAKTDYTRILSKVHEMKMAKKTEFLHALPMFSSWTRNSMQKLTYFFKEATYSRKQIVYRAGDVPNMVYFIREGELQMLQDVEIPSLSSSSLLPAKRHISQVQVALLTTGESIGHEEVLNGQPFKFTCMCHSASAQLLTISKDDFLRRVNTEDSLRAIKELIQIKDQLRNERMSTGQKIREMNKGEEKKRRGRKRKGISSQTQTETARTLSTSPVLSPRPDTRSTKDSTTFRYESPQEGYPRLYPFKDIIRESANRLSPRSEIGLETTLSLRRLKSWDRIFAHKTFNSPSKLPSKIGKEPHIVNIHTHRQRILREKQYSERRKTDFDRPKTGSRFSMSGDGQSPFAIEGLEGKGKPCLTINFVDMVPSNESKEESFRPTSPKLKKMVSSPHALFRLKKLPRSQDGAPI